MTTEERIKNMTADQAEALLQLMDDETWAEIDGLGDDDFELIRLACDIDPDFATMVESGTW